MKICYFGIYNPELGRNRIYIKGLVENGAEIIHCQNNSRGPLKFFNLFRKHWKIRNFYDALIVGYPGHIVVWLAKLISSKPVIFDALCTMEEGVVISRAEKGLKAFYVRLMDWLAVRCADYVLVESKAQKKFFEEKFGKNQKYKVVYTGADDSVFYPDPNVTKREKFTVVFRGKFLPESGIIEALETAKILENNEVEFLVIGNGFLDREVKKKLGELNLKNLELVSEFVPLDLLREKMLECHISLGQLADHPRLLRTIPHKCFETLALGIPYITAKSKGVSEILTDGEDCLMTFPADPASLAEAIMNLKDDFDLREKVAKQGHLIFLEKFTTKKLALEILNLLK